MLLRDVQRGEQSGNAAFQSCSQRKSLGISIHKYFKEPRESGLPLFFLVRNPSTNSSKSVFRNGRRGDVMESRKTPRLILKRGPI